MMPGDTASEDNDDYVVSLLLKDAEANRKRYLTSGLGPLLSKQPKGNAPKPNTRFLRNIIRETDSHNAALKAKEEEESQARLRVLRKDENGGKRRRDEDVEEGSVKRRRGDDRPGRWAGVLGGLHEKSEDKRMNSHRDRKHEVDERSQQRHRDRSERSTEREYDARKKDKSRRDTERMCSRNRSPKHRKGHRRRNRSRSTASSASDSPAPAHTRQTTSRDNDDGHEDSDPLEDFLGPKSSKKSAPRGRGAHKTSASAMDTRFSPSYNPNADVDLSPDDGERDDWDMALEALKDRAKWRTNGAERLRAAGFTEDEVGRWEKGGGGLTANDGYGEKDVEDVRWRKKGEGREWDRGKVIRGDAVELRAEWGRLKGT